jgi:hypothetical protein
VVTSCPWLTLIVVTPTENFKFAPGINDAGQESTMNKMNIWWKINLEDYSAVQAEHEKTFYFKKFSIYSGTPGDVKIFANF